MAIRYIRMLGPFLHICIYRRGRGSRHVALLFNFTSRRSMCNECSSPMPTQNASNEDTSQYRHEIADIHRHDRKHAKANDKSAGYRTNHRPSNAKCVSPFP